MLTAGFTLLTLAVLAGSLLAVLHMRENKALPAWPWAALHGLAAVGGLILLALSLGGPTRGAAQGTAGFGAGAAAILALAALFGAMLVSARVRCGQVPGALIAVHAMIAVSGFVVLMAYYFAG
ncbi:MAG: hypothetical protein P8Y53_10655 [Pseudolabrys sp.]